MGVENSFCFYYLFYFVIDCIYNEFEKDQYTFQTIGKEEIDNVYNAYNIIRNKNSVTFEDLKLLRLINAEVELLS